MEEKLPQWKKAGNLWNEFKNYKKVAEGLGVDPKSVSGYLIEAVEKGMVLEGRAIKRRVKLNPVPRIKKRGRPVIDKGELEIIENGQEVDIKKTPLLWEIYKMRRKEGASKSKAISEVNDSIKFIKKWLRN